MCKKCKKAFRKDMTAYEESDEYCPHCDNHYVRILSQFVFFLTVDVVIPGAGG
jgi:Zn finger protein HypA/HybF involved in hydrogenase expression